MHQGELASTNPNPSLTCEVVMLLRLAAWLLFVTYLIVVGLWPAALTPLALGFAGACTALAAIPTPVLLLTAAIAWWKRQPVAA